MAEGRVSRLNAICVVDSSGEIVSEGTVISEPVAIAEFIRAVSHPVPWTQVCLMRRA